jgi:hypothetical protein
VCRPRCRQQFIVAIGSAPRGDRAGARSRISGRRRQFPCSVTFPAGSTRVLPRRRRPGQHPRGGCRTRPPLPARSRWVSPRIVSRIIWTTYPPVCSRSVRAAARDP